MKQWITNKLLSYLFNALTPDNVVKEVNGKLYLVNRPLTEQERQVLKAEVMYLESTWLFKILTDTVKWQANQRMYEQSKSYDDMFFGKAILYAVDVQQKIINLLK
jgi:hypothetical protein